jgi:ubiquinone/menaquinone biosynthesis C-methylase UbiE
MPEVKGNSHFRLMSLTLWLRDVFFPPAKKLKKAGLKPGNQVVDFGCGPGSFSLAAAHILGQSGKVYALDIHPLAIQRVKTKAMKSGLQNIETISSDGATGLPEQSVDFVILNDVLHEVDDPDAVLSELHRVMKPEGILFFSDHHMSEKDVLTKLTQEGLFRYSRKGYRAYLFSKS